MCFKLGNVQYCSFHQRTQLVTIVCKGCQGRGCQLCNNKGVERYCPDCRDELTSKYKLIRPRL